MGICWLEYTIILHWKLKWRWWVDNLSHGGCDRDDMNDDSPFTLFFYPFQESSQLQSFKTFQGWMYKRFKQPEFNFLTNQSRESVFSILWGTNLITFNLSYFASKMKFLLQDTLQYVSQFFERSWASSNFQLQTLWASILCIKKQKYRAQDWSRGFPHHIHVVLWDWEPLGWGVISHMGCDMEMLLNITGYWYWFF